MNSGLPILALRDTGVELRGGDAYWCAWAHTFALADPPVKEFLYRDARSKVADLVGCTPDDVTVVVFSPDELAAAYERHHTPFLPAEPMPPNLNAVVAYWEKP